MKPSVRLEHALEKVNSELEKNNLPDLSNVVNKPFLFEVEEHVVCGTIESVGYAPNEGLSFRVTSPRFFGKTIVSISPTGGGTATVNLSAEGKHTTMEGNILIL